MATIDVETGTVSSIAGEIATAYSDLHTKLQEISDKRSAIPSYWSSKEADEFVARMDSLNDAFTAFETEYQVFMDSLSNIVKSYDDEESKLLAVLGTGSN